MPLNALPETALGARHVIFGKVWDDGWALFYRIRATGLRVPRPLSTICYVPIATSLL